MLGKRIIPCLDVKDGRVVKGVHFVDLRDAGDPVENARLYNAEEADELVFLDISATPEGRATTVDMVRKVAVEVFMPFAVGGGVRGAEDVRTEDERGEVYTAPTELVKVRRALEEAGLAVSAAELSMLPKNTVTLDEKSAGQVLRLLDSLEDLDDVQKVFSNADFPDSVLMEYAAAR